VSLWLAPSGLIVLPQPGRRVGIRIVVDGWSTLFDILPGPRHLGLLPCGFLALARATCDAPVGAPSGWSHERGGCHGPQLPTRRSYTSVRQKQNPSPPLRVGKAPGNKRHTFYPPASPVEPAESMGLVKVPSIGSMNRGGCQLWAKKDTVALLAAALALSPRSPRRSWRRPADSARHPPPSRLTPTPPRRRSWDGRATWPCWSATSRGRGRPCCWSRASPALARHGCCTRRSHVP
jgi:hypothetical protein